MENKTNLRYIIILLLCMCLSAGLAYSYGRSSTRQSVDAQIEELNKTNEELAHRQEVLQQLNRSSIENMVLEEGPIYVIGHKSPDSDTVCTAIAYANLLNELGYEAEPAITMPVSNETAYILSQAGVEVPEILYDASGLNIFLVDHSEYVQAVDNLIDGHIVGVIDHHGIGSINTGHQVVYEGRPMGATATIVYLDYLNYGVDISKEIAHVLLGAILSDTSYLDASTTSEADRQAIPALAQICGVENVDEFYRKIHEMSLSYEGKSDEEILFNDYKEYEVAGVKFGIGMLNAIDDETAKELAARMKIALEEYGPSRDVDLIYASVGMRENGKKNDYIICGNELSKSVLLNAFPNYDESDGTYYLYASGMGRKSVFVPGLTDYLSAKPHE